MSTLFTKIVIGEIPSYKVAEDDNFYDIHPDKLDQLMQVTRTLGKGDLI